MTRRSALLLAGIVLLARRLGRRRGPTEPPAAADETEPVVERAIAPSDPSAELVAAGLLAATAACAIAFLVVFFTDVGHATQLLGVTLGAALLLLATAFVVAGRTFVPEEEAEEDYPTPDADAQHAVAQIVEDAGRPVTRRRLLLVTGAGAGGALGLALLAPALSLGPLADWGRLSATPWRRGRRLVDDKGQVLLATRIEESVFYTAYPEGASRQEIGSPVVVVRLPTSALQLPDTRRDWAPAGILAYSKICTHAGCAISLYRAPLYEPTSPRPALICPCHYSTFDPAAAGAVLFGPAGRPLPQLPLVVDRDGALRAAGPLSAGPGPSWWSVRGEGTSQ